MQKIITAKKNSSTNSISAKAYIRYLDDEDLANLGVTTIFESYKSNSYKYVAANIKISNILKHKQLVKDKNILISVIGVELINENSNIEKEETILEAEKK